MKLNLGAGEYVREGYVNVDWQAGEGVDVVHDLNSFPYPFETGSVEEVSAYHVLEHLDRPFFVMRELHRILRPGGVAHIKVPHFSRGFTHAEHTHGFDVTFPLYFNPRFKGSGYYGAHFTLQSMQLRWFAFPHLLREMGYGTVMVKLLLGLSRFISGLANLSPSFASRVWCFWVGGFEEIEFRFTCVK